MLAQRNLSMRELCASYARAMRGLYRPVGACLSVGLAVPDVASKGSKWSSTGTSCFWTFGKNRKHTYNQWFSIKSVPANVPCGPSKRIEKSSRIDPKVTSTSNFWKRTDPSNLNNYAIKTNRSERQWSSKWPSKVRFVLMAQKHSIL